MDAFKGNEILRMEKGGNGRWKAFWEERMGKSWGRGCEVDGEGARGFEERYGGIVGEEWKERLGCEVEGREFKGIPERKEREKKEVGAGMGLESTGIGAKSQKEMNEDFFARKGNENENRSADLPPSQGGKYAGFGSQPTGAQGERGAKGEGMMPGVDDFQKDPVAALTKGLGWFTTTVGKSAKSVNDGWIQPNVQKVCYFALFFSSLFPLSLPFFPFLPFLPFSLYPHPYSPSTLSSSTLRPPTSHTRPPNSPLTKPQ